MTQADADREIASKTLTQIHVETADTWAKRAVAYRKAAERGGASNSFLWQGFDDARHEALEHAALAEDGGKTVKRIELFMKKGKR